MASYSLDELPDHPIPVLGPNFSSAILLGIMTGLITNLAYRFWREDFAEKGIIKLVVLFVTSLSFIQSALKLYSTYTLLIVNFADWSKVLSVAPVWIGKVNVLLSMLMSMPSKALFIWRAYKLARKYPKFILAFLIIIYLLETTVWIPILIQAFSHGLDTHTPNNPYVISAFVFPLATDFSIACALSAGILPLRPQIFTRSLTSSIYRLSFVVWETNIPLTINKLIGFLLYLTIVRKGFWADMLQDAGGQLYIIEVFVVLMGMQMTTGEQTRIQPSNATELSQTSLTLRRAVLPEIHNGPFTPGFELQSFPASQRSSSLDEDHKRPNALEHERDTSSSKPSRIAVKAGRSLSLRGELGVGTELNLCVTMGDDGAKDDNMERRNAEATLRKLSPAREEPKTPT